MNKKATLYTRDDFGLARCGDLCCVAEVIEERPLSDSAQQSKAAHLALRGLRAWMNEPDLEFRLSKAHPWHKIRETDKSTGLNWAE